MRRALLLLLFACPLTARVISYAPYTSRVADPAYQDRAARHFVLVETAAENYWSPWVPNELVLYDSKGEEEPRVISPRTNLFYTRAALYEPEGKTPVILAMATGQYFVSEGGTDWTTVKNLTAFGVVDTLDFDFGGAFTHGPFAAITLGNDRWPFIVTISNAGVWAIDRQGNARQIFDRGGRVIGRNARGDRFLIQFNGAIYSTSAERELAKVADVVPINAYCAGWLKTDGTAYILARAGSDRVLYKSTPTLKLELVGGFGYAAGFDTGSTIPRLRYFAVPTHDYEGAWIVARKPGQTMLQRHTSARGLETMWSDVTAPEVEALIPGRSGETVLVQVHRDRDVAELARPIIDPALAVWRVGQPAPKVFEELYLNENWNKGFVHVDADRIESGETFVFDSGFTLIEPVPSRVSAPIGGGGEVIQEWGVVRASFQQRLVLPGVARLPGAFASFWTTDVTIYNPLAEKQDVDVRFVPMDGQPAVSAKLTLEPHEIRAACDVLKTLFALESGGGALHLAPAVGVNAVARTYTTRADGGTYGFGLLAVDANNSIGPRFTATFAGAFPNDNFRTNVLLTDTSGRGAEAALRARTQYGSRSNPKETSIVALPQTTGQRNAMHGEEIGLNALEGASLMVEPKRGNAIASVVAIDNRTNDPTYFPPDLPTGTPRTIPLIAHLDENGVKVRSDLYVLNTSSSYRTLQLQARMWDTGNTVSTNFYLGANESVVIRDVLALFNRYGRAQLLYSGGFGDPADSIRVTSRTYTIADNGGTYGSLVPPLNGFQIGAQGDRLEILGISAGPGFRTNVALLDLGTVTTNIHLRLHIIENTGKTLDVMDVQLRGRTTLLLEDIFKQRGITPPPASMLVVEVQDGDQIAAFATLTDVITGDSIYLGANLGARPEAN